MNLFLDQADVIAEEGAMNARYHALIDLSAQLFISLGLNVEYLETSLSISRQWAVLNQSIRCSLFEKTNDVLWNLETMRIIRHRWILRAQKRSTAGPFFIQTTSEQELDALSTVCKQFPPIEVVTRDLKQGLDALDDTRLDFKVEGYMDLGEYFFNQKEFEQADEIFSQAQEISQTIMSDESSNIERITGFRNACQAMKSPCKMNQVNELWQAKDFAKVITLLRDDVRVGELPWGFKLDLERRARGLAEAPADQIALYNAIAGVVAKPDEFTLQDETCRCMRLLTKSKDLRQYFDQVCQSNRDHERVSALFERVTELLPCRMNVNKSVVSNQKAYWTRQHDPLTVPETDLAEIRKSLGNLQLLELIQSFNMDETESFMINLIDLKCWEILEKIPVSDIKDEKQKEIVQLGHDIAVLVDYCESIGDNATTESSSCILDFDLATLYRIVESKCQFLDKLTSVVHASLAAATAGFLQRMQLQGKYLEVFRLDLVPYGDLAVLIATAAVNHEPEAASVITHENFEQLWHFLFRCVTLLTKFSPREPKWHCALGDLLIHPFQDAKRNAKYNEALREFLYAIYLLTDYFGDSNSRLLQQVPENTMLRLLACLTKLGADVEAAVICQLFPKSEHRRGLQLLQLNPSGHNTDFYRYFWEVLVGRFQSSFV